MRTVWRSFSGWAWVCHDFVLPCFETEPSRIIGTEIVQARCSSCHRTNRVKPPQELKALTTTNLIVFDPSTYCWRKGCRATSTPVHQLNRVRKGLQRYHLTGDNFVNIDGSNAVDAQRDDEDDYLYTGHPHREVRTAPVTAAARMSITRHQRTHLVTADWFEAA